MLLTRPLQGLNESQTPLFPVRLLLRRVSQPPLYPHFHCRFVEYAEAGLHVSLASPL